MPAPGFLTALQRWCHDNGAVFIADEIQTGFCRTGDWFACDHEGVVPDLYLLGKALGGGVVPVSAVVGRREVLGVATGIPILDVGLPAILSLYFDVFSGVIQAFVFSLLTMIYVSSACPAPEDAA